MSLKRFHANAPGAVFNLLCTDKDHELIVKIENHFATSVIEVMSLGLLLHLFFWGVFQLWFHR